MRINDFVKDSEDLVLVVQSAFNNVHGTLKCKNRFKKSLSVLNVSM